MGEAATREEQPDLAVRGCVGDWTGSGGTAESASGGAEGKTDGKTGARKEYPQFPQVCARGGLDLPQFGQFILTSPAPKL